MGVEKAKRKCFKPINTRSERDKENISKRVLGCDYGDCAPLGALFTVSLYTFYKMKGGEIEPKERDYYA